MTRTIPALVAFLVSIAVLGCGGGKGSSSASAAEEDRTSECRGLLRSSDPDARREGHRCLREREGL